MPPQNVAAHPPLEAWQVETMRMTAFPDPAAQLTQPTWWHDLVGEEPDSRVSQPKRGGFRDEGPFGGGKLILALEPMRIDWVLTPIDDPMVETEDFLRIGAFPTVLNAFAPLMRRWFELDTCPPVQRLAFGAILLQPVSDLRSGYRQLAAYLPSMSLDVEGSSDFFYQINRPRESRSEITGLRIIRLSKWSVASRRFTQLSIGMDALQSAAQPPIFACRLELDINTAAEFQRELPRGQLSRIFQELVDFGEEIVREGDIP